MSAAANPRTVAGAEYVRALSERASDRRARTAFWGYALALTAPGDAIFDFGCGPGLDAQHYAAQGRRVGAYDIDPAMCDYFAQHCAEAMHRGRIQLERGSYEEFLARCGLECLRGRFVLVTANFAPLSMVDDLPQLFRAFAELTEPRGAVLASVLNPYCLTDLRYGWWWRNLSQLLRHGRYSLQGAQSRIWRRGLGDLAAVAGPHFRIESVTPGPALFGPDPLPGAHSMNQRLALLRCRFLFLLWRKQELNAASRASS